jgi:PPOX class probable F420-dependent enzyme
VWFVAADGKLYVFTAGEAGKVKRLRQSSRARVAPCDSRGGLRGDWQDATARMVTDAAVIARAEAAVRQKYGWQSRMLDLFSRPQRPVQAPRLDRDRAVAAGTARSGLTCRERTTIIRNRR